MLPNYRKFMMHTNGRVSTVSIIFLLIFSLFTITTFITAIEIENDGHYEPQDVFYVWGDGGPGWLDYHHLSTIQEAIDNANDTDTIYVWEGEYDENVIVNKSLTLIGNSTTNTTVNAGGSGSCFFVNTSWTNITGFHLNNTGTGVPWAPRAGVLIKANYTHVYLCKINQTDYGIYLSTSSTSINHHYNISNNVIEDITSGSAIHIINASWSEIYNNTITNATGITLESRCEHINVSFNNLTNANETDGITLTDSNFSIIKNNYIFNYSTAIHGGECLNNSIYDNYLYNSSSGIYFTADCNNNTIYQNIVKYNSEGGIVIQAGLGDSYNNTIYYNTLIDNIPNGIDSETTNKWNETYPIGGNYWSNYTGGIDHYNGVNQDEPGSDGIGDTNHTEGGTNIVDYYPLMLQYGKQSNIPVTKNPNPANDSFNLISLTMWNVTIESPNGSTFDWLINVTNDSTGYSIAENSSIGSINGSYYANITGNLSNGITYKVYVNVSTASSWTNDTYYFKTYSNSTINITNESPSNTSTQVEMYPLVSVLVNDTNAYAFNITWRTNATGLWADFGTDNNSVTNGTYAQRATFANESNTTYWWKVCVLNAAGNWTNETYYFTTDDYIWGDWSDWWQFNFSAEEPTNFLAASYNITQINLTWTKGLGGADKTVVVRNSTGVTAFPTSPTDGTVIYNDTGTSYEDIDLRQGTLFYYSAWSWNNTHTNFSLDYVTSSNRTQSDLGIWKPYPVNQSTGVERAPTNLSAHINGTNININFWFYNLTPVHDRWVDIGGWTSVDTNWYEVLGSALTGISPGTQFIWGDTGYNWSINITDGTNWLNLTFVYHTTGSRYDVTNSGDVVSADVSNCWANRNGQAPYDGIYDVTNSGDVVSADVSAIWSHRS